MKKNILKISFPVILISLLVLGNTALASEVTGKLSTGLSATNGDTVNGVVIAPPVASPVAGSYTSAQSVGLTADGATHIYYTIDGTTPACPSTGTLYSSPISVASSLTINAISCYPQSKSSTVATYAYTINIAPPPSGGGGGGGGGSYSSGGGSAAVTVNTTHGITGFVTLMADWGKTGAGLAADFNGDGKVDIMDFVWLMANWTK
jgi:hypothetical protein